MKFAAVFAIAFAVEAQQPAIPQDPEKARLEGQVLNSATGEPLRKTQLTLRMNVAALQSQRQPLPVTTYTTTSDATGKFEFPNVDPGDYQLLARHDGFADLRLGNTGNGKRVETILFVRADRKTNFLVKMVPYGAIAGVVLDEDGDPIRNLRVTAMTYRYTSNGRELREIKSARSNDLGEYRIFDLPTGRYFVKINPEQLQLFGNEPTASESYAPVFYPGVMPVSGAIPQDLAPGQQLRNLSFNLRKVHYATIRGVVVAPPDATSISAGRLIATESGSTSTSSGVKEEKGKFEFVNIPPGSIYLTGDYVQAGKRYDTMVLVDVGPSDIDGIELRPIPPADVTGTISLEGDPDVDVSRFGVSLDGASAGHNGPGSTTVGKDGRLTIPSVTPGRYRIDLGRTPATSYVRSIHWGTADITDSLLDLMNGIPPRTELAIVLANDAGEIAGTVANDKSEPVDAATVTLVPTGAHRSRPFYKTVTTDTAGHFTIRGIAPGSYKIFAWDQVDRNAVMYDPDFLRPYESAGQGIEVQSKGKHTADLKLILNKESDDRSR